MRSTTLSSLRLPLCTVMIAASMAVSALAQQGAPPRSSQATTAPAETPPPSPSAMTFAQSRRAVLPQGFSVVLVLGDLQAGAPADDVPLAARKALTDMRDFLPFKSYKLLDAAWVLCCGQDPRHAALTRGSSSATGPTSSVSQTLRGPEDREYELRLDAQRTEGSRVFVRFSLRDGGNATVGDAAPAESSSAASRTIVRRIADLRDRRMLVEKQIHEARRKVEIGAAPAGDVAKLEVELRRMDREIEDLSTQVAEARADRPTMVRTTERSVRSSIIDTSFSMDVGETVVVGTSRLKGGSKALIALLTAVPPRTATERRE